MESTLIVLALAAVALLLGWLFANALSWYFADPTRFFAPANTPGRVTFKAQLLQSMRDLSTLTGADKAWRYGRALGAYWLPRLTDRTMLAAIFADLMLAAQGQDVWLWLAEHRAVAGIVIIMNLLAAAPKSAPDRLPQQ